MLVEFKKSVYKRCKNFTKVKKYYIIAWRINNGIVSYERNEKILNKKKILKGIGITLLVILILCITSIVTMGIMVYSKFSKINTIQLENIEINEGVEEALEGYRNVAILGIDARADVYSGSRSDCIIIASINEKNKEVKLTSVYRDTYVYIDGHGYDKITHAYAYGGPELAINTINKNFDLDIKEFVAVNFDAVVEIIDAIKGVEIDIQEDELKYINSYIKGVNKQMGRNDANITHAGKQNLSGVQALAYSRIRYTEGGDYKRTERMRDVLSLVFEKAKKKNVFELSDLADMLFPRVYTNVDKTEILKAIPEASKYNITTSQGWPYEVRGYTGRAWYGVPVTLESNVKKLHEVLFGDNAYEVSSKVKEYSEGISKETGYR